jgi:excisionase family DNA binding protein
MPYLTIREVSETLRLHRVTVSALVRQGELRAIKGRGRNGRIKIDAASVEEYIARNAVQPTEVKASE